MMTPRPRAGRWLWSSFDSLGIKVIDEVLSRANKIVNDNIKDDLKLAQLCVEIYELLGHSDLTQEEVIDNYGTFLLVEDDLDDHGIPVKEYIREKWDKNTLTGLDKEMKEIISFYRKNIIEESNKLPASARCVRGDVRCLIAFQCGGM
jgi:hypothetical protein